MTIGNIINVDFIPSNEGRERFIYNKSIERALNHILQDDEYKEDLMNKIGKIILSGKTRHMYKKSVEKIIKELELNSEDDILKRKFIKVADILFEIYKGETGDIGNLRSALPDAIVLKLLTKKFGNKSKSGLSCFVVIKSNISKESKPTERTVDVGFWSLLLSTGECHECKLSVYKQEISDNNLIERQINNLNDISIMSFQSIKVAITALQESWIIRDMLLPISLGNVVVYGRDNIFDIIGNSSIVHSSI